ncbi:hypothetical protein ACLOJK_022954 [Asimina triloba]
MIDGKKKVAATVASLSSTATHRSVRLQRPIETIQIDKNDAPSSDLSQPLATKLGSCVRRRRHPHPRRQPYPSSLRSPSMADLAPSIIKLGFFQVKPTPPIPPPATAEATPTLFYRPSSSCWSQTNLAGWQASRLVAGVVQASRAGWTWSACRQRLAGRASSGWTGGMAVLARAGSGWQVGATRDEPGAEPAGDAGRGLQAGAGGGQVGTLVATEDGFWRGIRTRTGQTGQQLHSLPLTGH